MKELRKAIVHMTTHAGEGHIPSALSILDIVWVLYDRIMKINPKQPDDPDRDRFILSKGHGSPALYMVLARKGFLPNSTAVSGGIRTAIKLRASKRRRVPWGTVSRWVSVWRSA